MHRRLCGSCTDGARRPVAHEPGRTPNTDSVPSVCPTAPRGRQGLAQRPPPQAGGAATHCNRKTHTFVGPQQQSIPVQAAFSQSEVDNLLSSLFLPANTPLSVLAVELFNAEDQVINEQFAEIDPATNLQGLLNARGGRGFVTPLDASPAVAQPAAMTEATTNAVAEVDPLGANIGSQRILRVSPLTPVVAIC
jgi:hypothetical protein